MTWSFPDGRAAAIGTNFRCSFGLNFRPALFPSKILANENSRAVHGCLSGTERRARADKSPN